MLERLTFVVVIAVLAVAPVIGRASTHAVIPKPNELVEGQGQFVLRGDTLVVGPDIEEMRDLVSYVVMRLGPATGFRLRTQIQTFDAAPTKNAIALALDGDASLGEEGYTLVATPDSIRIAAHKPAGLFR